MRADVGPDVDRIPVSVPGSVDAGYEVRIQPGSFADLPERCRDFAPAHRYAVITDSQVHRLYGRAAVENLRSEGLDAEAVVFPSGEWNKTRQTWADVTDALLQMGLGRDAAIVALGGGVTGDLAGFVAATYMRGLPVVQVPTTLVAMLDASVGGKTGVDAPRAKNVVGAFHHPAHVLVDPELLASLPPYQRVAGLAEAVKAAAIADGDFLCWIEENASALEGGGLAETTEAIRRGVRIKAAVVEEDPTETGRRVVLNFGHTLGHALETLSGYSLLHGEAVAAGMRLAARIGEELGITATGVRIRLEAVLAACGLADRPEAEAAADGLLEAARGDKKMRRSEVRWVLLETVGRVARAPDGSWSHALPTDQVAPILAGALRDAAGGADS
ncbi:MAG: 3-dehydroquinate synthase [Gemmatimonadota bacterium]